MKPTTFSLLFGVVLLHVTGTLSQASQPQYVDETKIVGGNQSRVGQFPYQVSLRYTKSRAHFCGGTLVTFNHVLTAAHCIKQPNRTLKPADVAAYVGSIFLSSGGLYITVILIHLHYGYSMDTNVDDIAVLKLKMKLPPTSSVYPISIRESLEPLPTNTKCIVSGWGTITYNGSTVDVLRFVDVLIYQHDACKLAYGSNIIQDKMICAGFSTGGKDACQGDSGGPLVCGTTVTGIVSFGNRCALPGFPGVYTEVTKYRKWLLEAINASVPTSTISLYLLVVAHFAYFLLH